MQYIVMVRQKINAFPGDTFHCEFSGKHHPDRESARREMATITRNEREFLGIEHVWIEEVDEC